MVRVMQGYAPVALFVYNRPEHVRRTVAALLANAPASETPLVIFSDAARGATDVPLVAAVREYIRTVNGFRSVRIVEQAGNRGLANSVIAGVTEVVGQYGRVIVLEDDMELSPYFLDYMNRALDKYRDDDRVWCIHGYAFPVSAGLPDTDTFFLRGAECWGWATWARAWDRFCPDSRVLLEQLRERRLTGQFDYDGAFPYLRMLRRQARGKVDSWAIRWRASAFAAGGLTLWPRQSLVRNIGMDGSGVHCDETEYFEVRLATRPVVLDDIPVEASRDAYHAYGRYLKQQEGGILTAFRRFLKRRLFNVIPNK